VARGTGLIDAKGAVRTFSGGGFTSATQLYLMGQSGDAGTQGASFVVNAGNSAAIQSIANPTALSLPASVARTDPLGGGTPGFGNFRTNFYTYAPDTSAAVAVKSGDLVYGNQLASKSQFLLTPSAVVDLATPASPPVVLLSAPGGAISQP